MALLDIVEYLDPTGNVLAARVPPDGSGELRTLTPSTGAYEAVAWSPDGTQLAALYSKGVLDFPRNTHVAVVAAAGGEPRFLTEKLDNFARLNPSRAKLESYVEWLIGASPTPIAEEIIAAAVNSVLIVI